MKLIDLLKVFEYNLPFTIELDGDHFCYRSTDELWKDSVFYEEVKNKVVTSIWFSKYLYETIVIVLA